MKLIKLRIAILAIVCSAGDVLLAGDAGTANIQNCTWCHGTSAQGYGTAPRLAGQRHEYTQKQLRSFGNHTRDNPLSKQYMWGATAALNSRTARDLAIYFSTLPAKAANDGHKDLVVAGRAIYEEGIPNSNIASCLVCHAPDGKGFEGIPRLGGLSYSYLKKRLEQWGEGYHAAAEPPMPRIASKLPPNVIEAVASYLSFAK